MSTASKGVWGKSTPPSILQPAAATTTPSPRRTSVNNGRGSGGNGSGGRGRGGGGNGSGGRGRGGGGYGDGSGGGRGNDSRRGGGGGKNNKGRGRGVESSRGTGSDTARGRGNSSSDAGGGSSLSAAAAATAASTRPYKSLSDIPLLLFGAGSTDAERAVFRHPASTFLACRLSFLDPPNDGTFKPHEQSLWNGPSEVRIQQIQAEMDLLWNYAPIQINEEKRWKANVMKVPTDRDKKENDVIHDAAIKKEMEEEQLRKAFVILNKISWTTLDKLTIQFAEVLGVNNQNKNVEVSIELAKACMALVVEKAMLEPHFAELYAVFASKVTVIHKSFKKLLLSLCQELFDSTEKEPELPADLDPAERLFQLNQSRKKSIGLMHFIGELYKLGLIRGEIMISCLKGLLVLDDEERLECFARLMTTIGSRLHEEQDDNRPEMKVIWEQTYSMAGRSSDSTGPKAPTTRIKFLLQDLIELKENDWVKRREEEKAKTLAEIHKEVEQEEQAAAFSSMQQRRSSKGDVRVSRSSLAGQQPQTGKSPWKQSTSSSSLAAAASASSSSAPTPSSSSLDKDGFIQIKSSKQVAQNRSNYNSGNSNGKLDNRSKPKSSLQLAMASTSNGSLSGIKKRGTGNDDNDFIKEAKVVEPVQDERTSINAFEGLSRDECVDKTKNLLREYFIGGDTDDAVLTVEELVDAGHDGNIDRGAAVIEGGVLFAMESSESDAIKFLALITRCLKEEKIDKASLVKGLNDPLEYLRDIEIDAPRAPELLARMLAEWLDLGFLSFDMFETAPAYFLSDGRAAEFAVNVAAKLNREASMTEVETIANLMNDKEREDHPSVTDWIKKTKE